LRPPRPLAEAGELDLAAFDCGNLELNGWLRLRARENDVRAFSRVFVLGQGTQLVGYYALSAYAIERKSAPRDIRHGAPDPVAAILLGQLAVAQPWHGRGVGASLLQDAVRRFVAAADIVAARLLVTHPTDATARSFYARHGWASLKAAERPVMYVLLEWARAAVSAADAADLP
jgi:predicted N-acetyltransferase YhbS